MIKGTGVYHCHGKRAGKLIKRHKTHAAALAQHRAIMSNKHRRDYLK